MVEMSAPLKLHQCRAAQIPARTSQASAVSAFFPCYNDTATISVLVRHVAEVLGSVTSAFEVIVVDDGSRDGSLPVSRALERESAYLRVAAHDANRGYGAALLSGFRAARYEWVSYTDGDGEYDPAEVSTLIPAVGPATDIVQEQKLSLNVRDIDCAFCLFRRRLLELGAFRFTEVPVHHYFRAHGRQSWSRLVLREARSSTAAPRLTLEQRPSSTRAGRSIS
jgi:glycosyltransferase involved in cell wall biosynthesis